MTENEEFVTEDGVEVTLNAENFDEWEFDNSKLRSAALLIGPTILREACRDMFVVLHAEDDSSRRFGSSLRFGVQGLEGDINIFFDPTKAIDWWISVMSGSDGKLSLDAETTGQAQAIMAWLEAQTTKLKEALAAGIQWKEKGTL